MLLQLMCIYRHLVANVANISSMQSRMPADCQSQENIIFASAYVPSQCALADVQKVCESQAQVETACMMTASQQPNAATHFCKRGSASNDHMASEPMKMPYRICWIFIPWQAACAGVHAGVATDMGSTDQAQACIAIRPLLQ